MVVGKVEIKTIFNHRQTNNPKTVFYCLTFKYIKYCVFYDVTDASTSFTSITILSDESTLQKVRPLRKPVRIYFSTAVFARHKMYSILKPPHQCYPLFVLAKSL